MAKKKSGDLPETEQSEATLTPELGKAIQDLIYQKKMINRDNEALNEANTQVAERLGIKPADLKKRIALIIKEEEKGGEIMKNTKDLDFAEKYFNVMGGVVGPSSKDDE